MNCDKFKEVNKMEVVLKPSENILIQDCGGCGGSHGDH